MGIYRTIRYTDANGRELRDLTEAMGREVTVEIDEPGLTWTATLKPEDWTESRTDCFCCSCGEDSGSDAACRNHGFAGKRPCELHGRPGAEWDDTDIMPKSVQEARAGDRG